MDNKIKKKLIKRAVILSKRISPIYELLEWKWCGDIPTEADILNTFKRLINDYPSDCICHATGGLSVRKRKEEGKVVYELSFSIEENIYE